MIVEESSPQWSKWVDQEVDQYRQVEGQVQQTMKTIGCPPGFQLRKWLDNMGENEKLLVPSWRQVPNEWEIGLRLRNVNLFDIGDEQLVVNSRDRSRQK